MLSDQCNSGSLFNKYRPQTLSEVKGQTEAVDQVGSFLATRGENESRAFLFHGPTGIGKTALALAVAVDLGCDMQAGELGGLHELASGRQDGQAVTDLMRLLRLRPMFGSGWKVAILNEADGMSAGAVTQWLDAMEHLPPRTVLIFTTNDPAKLPNRFLGRVEMIRFVAVGTAFVSAMRSLLRRIWRTETGKPCPTLPRDIGRFELASSDYSIRLAIQQLSPFLRGARELPTSIIPPIIRCESIGSDAAHKAWATRRRKAVARV